MAQSEYLELDTNISAKEICGRLLYKEGIFTIRILFYAAASGRNRVYGVFKMTISSDVPFYKNSDRISEMIYGPTVNE